MGRTSRPASASCPATFFHFRIARHDDALYRGFAFGFFITQRAVPGLPDQLPDRGAFPMHAGKNAAAGVNRADGRFRQCHGENERPGEIDQAGPEPRSARHGRTVTSRPIAKGVHSCKDFSCKPACCTSPSPCSPRMPRAWASSIPGWAS